MSRAPTPGPWRLAKGSGGIYGAVVSDAVVVRGLPDDACAHEREAYGGYLVAESIAEQDRPLIAAAPELRDALIAAVSAIENRAPGLGYILPKLRAALAKAEVRP